MNNIKNRQIVINLGYHHYNQYVKLKEEDKNNYLKHYYNRRIWDEWREFN